MCWFAQRGVLQLLCSFTATLILFFFLVSLLNTGLCSLLRNDSAENNPKPPFTM